MLQLHAFVAYHSNQMSRSRRVAVFSLVAPLVMCAERQFPPDQRDRTSPRHPKPDEEEDQKLPNGKSQKDAMAKEAHEQALKDAGSLVSLAEQLRDELQKAGNYVVPVNSLKKTEEIEKLARRIRGKLRQ
jgi:hypothetical protein